MGAAIVRAVERHTADTRLADDLTILLLAPHCTGAAARTAGRVSKSKSSGKRLDEHAVVRRRPHSSCAVRARAGACDAARAQDGGRRHRAAARRARAGRASPVTRPRYLALRPTAPTASARARLRSTELLPGATRAVVKERDREPLPGHAGRQRLPPDGGRPHRVRRARARATWRLDVKRVGEPAPRATGPSPTRSACRRSRTSIGSRSTPTKQFAARDLRVAAETSTSRSPRARCSSPTSTGRDRLVLHRPRHDEVPSGAGDRAGAGQDLLRQRDARDALRRRVHADQPGRLRDVIVASALQPKAADPRSSAGRRRCFATTRRSRSSSTSAISAARPGRCCRPPATSSPKSTRGGSTR